MPSAVNMEAEMKALACVAVVLSLMINAVTAADYVVGNPSGGWDGRTDYKSWAASQMFAPGDTLTFKYNSYHNVLEVTKEAYDACTTTNPISFDSSGSTTVLLTMPGTRYFICGGPGHCLNGMKMEVHVADRPAPTTPSSSPPLPPAPSPAPMPWAPAPAPAAAHAGGHKMKKHKKKKGSYCSPGTLAPTPARPPVVQAVESLFPFADVTPMSSPPPPATSGGPVVTRGAWGEASLVFVALVGGIVVVAL